MQNQEQYQSPLVEITLNTILEGDKKIDPVDIPRIRIIINNYILGIISASECFSVLAPLIGSMYPMERLEAILRTPDMPLPIMSQMGGSCGKSAAARAKTRPWSAYEDQRLLAAVHKFGLDDWVPISNFVGNGRTKAQCSQRWARGLDPKINKDQWSPDQDDQLIKMVAEHGLKSWTRIATELGDRCDVQCRYRYKQLLRETDFQERLKKAQSEVKDAPPSQRKRNMSKNKKPKHQNAMVMPSSPFPPNFIPQTAYMAQPQRIYISQPVPQQIMQTQQIQFQPTHITAALNPMQQIQQIQLQPVELQNGPPPQLQSQPPHNLSQYAPPPPPPPQNIRYQQQQIIPQTNQILPQQIQQILPQQIQQQHHKTILPSTVTAPLVVMAQPCQMIQQQQPPPPPPSQQGVADGAGAAKNEMVPFHLDERFQISPAGSLIQWQGSLISQQSTGFFPTISPMNSFTQI